MAITYRQLIQSIKDYKDQRTSVMPYADGAEDPVWGISDIWFGDGVLNIGQYDDEGDSCEGIADGIEKCVPADKLDEPAVVKIGTIEGDEDDEGGRQIYNAHGRPARARTVASSVVKPASERVDEYDEYHEDNEDADGLCDDGWFCKWVLKFE